MADTPTRLKRLRLLARLMDSAFGVPGTRLRFGLDPAIGLLPVVGDLLALGAGAWIVFEAWRLGAGRLEVAGMVVRIVVDAVIGSVPLVGDVADVFLQPNQRNVELLAESLRRRGMVPAD